MTTIDRSNPLDEPPLPGLGTASVLDGLWGEHRQTVAGLRFVVSTPSDAAGAVISAAVRHGRAAGEHIHLANAYSVALSSKDPGLALGAFTDGWNLPDGKPLSWVSRSRRHRPRLRQVAGPDLFLQVCDRGRELGVRHYLLGSTPEVLARLEFELRSRFPGITIAGSDSPPFREPTAAELDARDGAIRDSAAQIVWVGLGTPKQDIEAARLAAGLPVIAVAVGAGFDYAAGTLRHAPRWMSEIGMEWLFRLAMEPRRLWRRYVFGNSRFIWLVLRERRRTVRQ